MPYIGKEPEHGNYQLLDALTAPSGVFDGSRTVFNLTADGVAVYPTSPTTLIISLGGVLQEPNSSYTVSGNQITFTTAPATGTNFFGVSLGDTLDIGTPSDGSVTVAKMAANSVDSAQYVDGSIDNVHLATGIDAVKLADGSVTNAELQYINSLSSNAQTQITAKAPIASPTFTTGATSPSFITGNSGTIKLVDGDGNHFTTIAAHATTAADIAYTWPDNAPGTSGYALTSTTGGVMSWAAAGGIASVAADTTPQLGGNLDVVDKLITSASNSNVRIQPAGNGDIVMAPNGVTIGTGGSATKAPVQILCGPIVSHRANCLELVGPTGDGLSEPASNGTSDSGGGGQLSITSSTLVTSGNSYGQGLGGKIIFGGKYHSGGYDSPFATIAGLKESNSQNSNPDIAGYLSFATRGAADPWPMTERMKISSGGDVTGTHGSYHTASDERIKENIITSDIGLSILMQMRPVKFNFLEAIALGTRTRVGFIAQEIEALVPEVVNTSTDVRYINDELIDDIPDMKSIEDMQLIPILVKAIQELNAKVDALQG